ncbi:MAG: 16S rRNA (cytosine(1402)-N(4))-methyltransferase [Gammaproteobacteria bacterium HGW-Gammaproteobacteria-10]|nr:MAG: 16S rRNA (cytosine(1402)-N(4))-methyltransferase [Gammaproteobacteria bacterium HGW-Gammaproteobacteria-10]
MEHLPVLFSEALQALAIKTDGIYIDCTFGRGGHSRGILDRLGPSGRLLALDRDVDAIQSEWAHEIASDKRFSLHHACFSSLQTIAEQENVQGRVDGLLMDLGVSSPQLDTPERGFSFLYDGPLDMRMDHCSGLSAAQWLTEVDERDLVQVLFEFGEERFARRIARAIVEQRQEQPLSTTRQLAELIVNSVPVREKHKHPATRTFQAIRIAVNRELEELKSGLEQAVDVLKPGGRLVVISFHSLEDRIAKRFIRAESGAKYDPGRLPIMESEIKKGILRKVGKAIKAGGSEVAKNPRARSAIMRVAERL